MFDFKVVTEWIDEGLRNLLPASLVNIWHTHSLRLH